jgi:CRISPR-associated endonuclease Csn1
LYTGKTIDINNINDYEVDHIIPRSLIKNDSIENKVLTSKQFNKDVKKDVYPFGNKISTDARKILDSFEKNKIISNTKYENIICNDECKKDKIINDFINRDLVQTG